MSHLFAFTTGILVGIAITAILAAAVIAIDKEGNP